MQDTQTTNEAPALDGVTASYTEDGKTTQKTFESVAAGYEWLAGELEFLGACALREGKHNLVHDFNAHAEDLRDKSENLIEELETSDSVNGVAYAIETYAPEDRAEAVQWLALEFAATIRDWLTPEQLDQAIEGNKTSGNACCTHDHCDPNQAMIDQFAMIWRREPHAPSAQDAAAINEAWSIARAADFWKNQPAENT